MQRRQKPVISLLLLCLATLAACSHPAAAPPAPEQPGPAVVQPKPSEPQQPTYAYTAPLTGMGTNEPVDKRPVMVMINNAPPARPQSGLDKADIVYEVLAEGEMTRFLAIYHSQKPETIGPVRSIRPYFIQIGAGFDAVMIHAGGSPEALETLARSDYSAVNEISNSRYFWREKFREAPHNLYTNPGLMEQAIQDKGMRTTSELPTFTFLPQDAAVTEGEPAGKINISYHPLNKISYTYDPTSKTYKRYTAGKPHIDLTSNQQLAATNLLVIASKHRVLDSEGRRHVDVVGPGDGYLFQQGKARKVKWKRSGGVIRAYADAQLTQELPLLPGNTWVNIVPQVPGLNEAVKFQ